MKFTNSSTKIETLVESISLSIMQEKLRVGDNLPSINEASAHYKVSRDTVFKAYNELKKRSLIDSKPTKGYYVTGSVNRVLLLLDNYSAFKQNLYHQFAVNLGENYKVDLIFHQYNEHLFETILNDSIGKYSMYVIMNFSNDKLSDTLKKIPANKLLLLDFGNFEKSQFSYICQDFDVALYDCLKEGLNLLKKYKKLSFIFPEDLRHPISSINYFKRFCADFGFESEVLRHQSDWKGIEKSCAYLCIDTDDMVRIIKEANASSLEIAVDVGIIAYNDDPVLEVIKNGITAISVDFGLMGAMAANFVRTKVQIQEILPTHFVSRASI